jgi:antitoxin MazE
MNTKITAWGNSLAVRIPKDLLKEFKLKENDEVTIEGTEKGIVIASARKKYNLRDLVKKIDDNNVHREISAEEAVGNETW